MVGKNAEKEGIYIYIYALPMLNIVVSALNT